MVNLESIFDSLDKMRESGLPEEEILRRTLHLLRKKARETDTPVSGHFELTPLCNLDCKMCYVHLNGNQMNGKKLLSAAEWIRLAGQAIETGMLKAVLSGGECLTYPGFDEVFLFLKSQGIPVSVLTNGVLLDGDRIRFFQKSKPQKIKISLYGSNDDAYERVTGKRIFSTVLDNIIAARNAGLPVKISITPSKYMLEDVKNTIKLVKDLDIPYAINLGLMTPRPDTGRKAVNHDITIDDYIDIIKYNRNLNGRFPEPGEFGALPHNEETEYVEGVLKCGAGRSTFSINWQGVMNPCTQLTSIEANPLREGFMKAWESINAKVKIFPKFKRCLECSYSQACDFCAAENEKMGSRFTLNPMWCERTGKMVQQGLRVPDLQCD